MAKYDPEADIKSKQADAKRDLKIKSLRDKGMNERDAVIGSMVSMKKSQKPSLESAVASGPTVDAPGAPKEEYPYGLRISLSSDELDKLGLPELPKVGDTFQIKATAKVDSISQNHRTGSDPSKSVDLQITDMHVCEGGSGLDEYGDEKDSEQEPSGVSDREAVEEEGDSK